MAKQKEDNEKVGLTEEDWNILLPGREFTVGKTTVYIEPLGLKDFVATVKRLDSIRVELATAGLTLENYSDPAGIVKLATLIMDNVPDVLSDSSGIKESDLKKLPLGVIMNLLSVVLDVNIESQEGLLKNFTALAGKVVSLINSLSGRSLNSSSGPDIDGQISEDTPSESLESSSES